MDDHEGTPNQLRRPVRIWIDGCFDLAHFGHANALRQARNLGDVLVVGVHPDEEIKKHKGAPVYTQEERYRLVKAIKWVDEVVEDVPYVTDPNTLELYSCDYVVHGDDVVSASDGSDVYHPFKVAGRYKEFKRTEGISTTELISRILDRMEKSQKPQVTPYLSDRRILRRTRSMDSILAFGLYLLHSPEGKDLLGSHQDKNSTQTASSYAAVAATASSTKPSWTNCGMPYMPHTLRIIQFCAAPDGTYGLREPTKDDVVVYAPGSFDLFHVGHLSFLEKCLEYGNYLLIGLHSDTTAVFNNRRMGTILTLQERLLSVLACRVNFVIVGQDTRLMPYKNGLDPMRIPKQRGIFRRVDSGSLVTTTSVISRILKHRVDYENRNRAKEAKEAQLMSTLRTSSTCTVLSLPN
ncbi:unnamed protein product [Dicrocoelium dendriticum]|nr:unnamed protein product [Dicrocoelium dendriticum]